MATLAGLLESRSPETGLADPRLALQKEAARPGLEPREETIESRQLRLSAEEHLGRVHHSTVAPASPRYKTLEFRSLSGERRRELRAKLRRTRRDDT